MRSSDWSSDVCSSDLKEPRARYFLAVKKDLAGDHRGAIDDWFALLADTPQGAPWEPDLRRTIEQVGAIHQIEVKTIGRASCRERVCTYVEISVVAVQLKKKPREKSKTNEVENK